MEQHLPQPTAHWDSTRDCWMEHDPHATDSLFSVPSGVWQETWPTSGMTLGGSVYPLPPSVPRTPASGSSSSPTGAASTLLPSPRTSDSGGPGVHGHGGQDLRTVVHTDLHGDDRLLKTPGANLAENGGSQHPDKRKAGGHGPTLADEVEHLLPVGEAVAASWDGDARYLLPTPNPFHSGNTEDPQEWRERRADVFDRTGTRHGPALSVVALSVEQGDPLTPDNYMPDDGSVVVDDEGEPVLFGTPTARMGKGSGPVGSKSHDWLLDHGNVEAQVLMLPTPEAGLGEHGRANGVDPALRRAAGKQVSLADVARHELLPTPVTDPESANGHARDLGSEARLLPTPMVGSSSPAAHGQISGQWRDQMAAAMARWGDYAPAILRWTNVLGRPAPDPTEPGSKGQPRLSARFVEWMMGLPAGHVTDVPDVSRNDQLKLLGNGVVTQQAVAGLRQMLATFPEG